VYVLEYADSFSANQKYYIGVTNDVWRRIFEHISGQGVKDTRKFGVREIVAVYPFSGRREAELFKEVLITKQQFDSEFEVEENENCVHIDVHELYELLRSRHEDFLRALRSMEISSSK
jgi:predicted GIY-YIG superfamily endonuclease